MSGIRDLAGLGIDGFFGQLCGASTTAFGLLEPVGVAVHLQDVDVVGQAVEQCTGQSLGGEDAGPFLER